MVDNEIEYEFEYNFIQTRVKISGMHGGAEDENMIHITTYYADSILLCAWIYVKNIQGYDIACQEDCGTLCAGFFIARGNDSIRNLFEKVYRTFTSLVNDQVALNYYRDMVNFKLLDNKK